MTDNPESRRLITQQSIDASNRSADIGDDVGEFAGIRGGIDGLGLLLRELRGELARIRTRLDSLVAIEKQLSYQGARMSAIEKRLTTLVEMRLNQSVPVPSATFQSPPG